MITTCYFISGLSDHCCYQHFLSSVEEDERDASVHVVKNLAPASFYVQRGSSASLLQHLAFRLPGRFHIASVFLVAFPVLDWMQSAFQRQQILMV